MYAEVCRFIIRLTHLRKPWKHHDNIQRQVMVERLCFLFRWNSRHRKKIHGDYDDPTPCRHFRFFAQKFHLPYPKISATPQRPWLAWAAALRQPLGHFLFPPRRQKGATSIEPCHIIRNTGDHEAHSLRTFVASLRQVWVTPTNVYLYK